MSKIEGISDLYEEVTEKFPELNILINNAGEMRKIVLHEDHDLYDITREIEINLMGPIRMVQKFLPHLKKQQTAAILNVTSGIALGAFHTEGLNLTYFSKLFGKTVIHSGSVNVDWSERSLERVRGLFTGAIVLKANNRTKINVGILYTTDPGTFIRVIPIFLLEHKFNESLMADVFLPRYAYLRLPSKKSL